MFVCWEKLWSLVLWISVIRWIGMAESSPVGVCLEGILNCANEGMALMASVVPDIYKASSVATSASLKDLCRVWLEASPSFQEQLRSSECSRPMPNGFQRIRAGLSMLDSLANYGCKENFIKVERNFRCLTDTPLDEIISESCADLLDETNACDLIPEVTECSSKAIASKCGEEAEQIAKEIGPWFWRDAFQYVYQKKCPSPTNDEECGKALMGCFAAAIERYDGKDMMEVFEEIRNTPIRTHCSDWNSAVGCFRQVIYTDICDDAREQIQELDKNLEIFDWFSNYICVEHVDKVDRSFRCVVSLELFSQFASSCADEIGDQNMCTVIANKDSVTQCADGVVTETCGAEAASVVRGLSSKYFELLEINLADQCGTSNRARQLEVLKNILRRL